MSSLIFSFDKDQAFIAVDTLATNSEGKPFMFTNKAFTLPHLRMLICGTGLGGFLGKWFIFINDNMIIKGIDNLDHHAPKMLRDLWRNFLSEKDGSYIGTTTIYHFGFSENTNSLKSYVYRLANDFESEFLQKGIGVKPECSVRQDCEFLRDIPSMMQEQRLIQSKKPLSERVFIGGEIMIYHLERSGICINSLGKFDDFDKTQKEIGLNYSSSAAN
jgi:hypothetical protein